MITSLFILFKIIHETVVRFKITTLLAIVIWLAINYLSVKFERAITSVAKPSLMDLKRRLDKRFRLLRTHGLSAKIESVKTLMLPREKADCFDTRNGECYKKFWKRMSDAPDFGGDTVSLGELYYGGCLRREEIGVTLRTYVYMREYDDSWHIDHRPKIGYTKVGLNEIIAFFERFTDAVPVEQQHSYFFKQVGLVPHEETVGLLSNLVYLRRCFALYGPHYVRGMLRETLLNVNNLVDLVYLLVLAWVCYTLTRKCISRAVHGARSLGAIVIREGKLIGSILLLYILSQTLKRTIGDLGLLNVLACSSVVTVMGVVLVRTVTTYENPTVTIVTYGSTGDRVPLAYYAKWLQELGLSCDLVHAIDSQRGREVLRAVEQDRFWAAFSYLKEFVGELAKQSKRASNSYLLAPLDALSYRKGVITYDLSPPLSVTKTFKLLSENVRGSRVVNGLALIARAVTSCDLKIGSFKGFAPRSSDGETLLTERPNLGLRRTLVCMGSSTLPEPDGLDLESTFSTRPDSRYTYEPRKDHSIMFAEYEQVICHGGAGTMATAAACGCKTVSASEYLDRRYEGKVDWDFNTSRVIFLDALVSKMEPGHVLAMSRTIWRNLDKDELFVFMACVMKRLLTLHVRMLVGFSTLVLTLAPSIVVDPSLFNILRVTCVPPSTDVVFQLLVIGMLYCAAKVYMETQTQAEKVKCAIFALSHLASVISRPLFWALVPITGLGLSVALIAALDKMRDLVLPRLLSLACVFSSCAANLVRDDNEYISLRFIPLRLVGYEWYPLSHTELVNPKTGMAIGIDVEGTRTRFYERPADPNFRMALTLNIPITRFDEVKENMMKGHGLQYHPLANCQTLLWRAIKPYTNIWSLEFLILTASIAFVFLTMVGIGSLVGLLSMVLIGSGAHYSVSVVAAMPLLTFAGGDNPTTWSPWEFVTYLLSPSFNLNNDRVRDLDTEGFPLSKCSRGQRVLGPRCKFNFHGQKMLIYTSGRGLWRPDANMFRNGSPDLIHGLDPKVLSAPVDPKLGEVTRLIKAKLNEVVDGLDLEDIGTIGIMSTTADRPIDVDGFYSYMHHLDWLIILSDRPIGPIWDRCSNVVIPLTGRALSCARLMAPARRGITYASLNASLGKAYLELMPTLFAYENRLRTHDFVTISPLALHQASAGALLYKGDLELGRVPNYEFYGADELGLVQLKGCIITTPNTSWFDHMHREQRFPCDRTILTVTKGLCVGEGKISHWTPPEIMTAIRTKPNTRNAPLVWRKSGENIIVETPCGDKNISQDVNLVLQRLNGRNSVVNGILLEFRKNMATFYKRVDKLYDEVVAQLLLGEYSEGLVNMYIACERLLDVFAPVTRKPKPVWSPVLDRLKPRRAPELSVVLAENPRFCHESYNDTLLHYISALNKKRGDLPPYLRPEEALSLHEFRRRVNRSPYVDLKLQAKAHELGGCEGFDGQILACREVMIATLSRYCGTATVDALTLDDKHRIARSIINARPELFLNANLATPKRLFNHFMKHKSYSCGLPFSGSPTGPDQPIKTRAQLKKAGWMKCLEAIALEPYTTGVWLPSIAHAFPKSQVIKASKLMRDPSDLRSVTATSVINNMIKGVLNFDINNRHDYLNSNSKVGMPLNGCYMNKVFSALNKFEYKASADVTKMDSNLPEVVFEIEALIRKAGYENHPAAALIHEHIDCAMQMTQKGYIVNLIDETKDSARSQLDTYHGDIWDNIPDEAWERVRAKHDSAEVLAHPSAPGGVVVKRKGGYTGDSDTTWTNTIGLQIIILKCIEDVHGIPFERFFKECYLANVGDDNMLGFNFKPDFNAIQAAAKRLFGVELRLEGVGEITDQTFLGKHVEPGVKYAYDFERAGIATPEFAVKHGREKLMMRYMTFKADAKRQFRNPVSKNLYMLNHTLGYLSLSAHHEDLYRTFVEDFKRWESELPERIRNARWFKKQYKVPSYTTILKTWYKEKPLHDLDTVSKLQFSFGIISRSERIITDIFKTVENVAYKLPTQLFNLEDPELLNELGDHDSIFLFEKHAWYCFEATTGREPSETELIACLKQSPFSKFTAPKAFMHRVVPFLDRTRGVLERERLRTQTRVIVYSLLYYNVNSVLEVANRLPFGSTILGLFNAYTFALPKYYQALNYLHYLGKGTSSLEVSQLMPKDAYLNHKRLAYLVMSIIPESFIPATGVFNPVLNFAIGITEMLSKASRITLGQGDNNGNRPVIRDGPWVIAVEEAMKTLESDNAAVVVAPTGTGKTRFLPKVCLGRNLRLTTIKQVVVVMPRRVLCEDYAKHVAYYKRRGRPMTDAPLVTMTYGHLMAMYNNSALIEFPESTLFILDECHETGCEVQFMIKSLRAIRPVIMLTATPESKDLESVKKIYVDVQRTYDVTFHKAYGFSPVALLEKVVKEKPGRYLIIHPFQRQVEKIANSLSVAGYTTVAVTANQRVIPDDPRIHIAATSIVDSGINIPDLVGVIDCGLRVGNERGSLEGRRVDYITMMQRAGRTGRFCTGDYYLLNGRDERQYRPAPSLDQVLMDSPLASMFRIQVNLKRNAHTDVLRLPNNEYVHLSVACPNHIQRMSLGLLHSLRLTSKSTAESHRLYSRAQQGILDDATENFLTINNVDGVSLLALDDALELEKRCQPFYSVDGKTRIYSIPRIKDNKVVFTSGDGAPSLPELVQTADNEHYFGNIVEFNPVSDEITGVSFCENAEGMAKAGFAHFVQQYLPSSQDDKPEMSEDQL